MAKRSTPKRIKAPTTDPRMMRVNQRAHKFTDRKKKANRDACRGRFMD
jgi:hypothetical protein